MNGSEEKLVRTACPSHCPSNACGILAHVKQGRVTKLEPAEFPQSGVKRICLKGLAATQLLYHPDRLKYPLKRAGERGEGKWERLSWDDALDIVAAKLKEVAERYGSKSVAWVLGGPGGGSTKFGAYTRLASLFQGTRVSCWGYGDAALPCAGHVMFGHHRVGRYTGGFKNTKLNIAWGTNAAETNPFDLMRRLLDDKEKGVRLVVIDPIFTATASKADEYISIRPGTDTALALGMMNVILHQGLQDEDYIRRYTVGPLLVRHDNGLFLREKDILSGGSDSYMVWDVETGQAKTTDTSSGLGSLAGSYAINGLGCSPAFQLLADLIDQYTPEVASEITEIPTETIRRLAIAYGTSKPTSIYFNNGVGRNYYGDILYRAMATLAVITGTTPPPGDLHYSTFDLNWGEFLHPNKAAPSYTRMGVLNMYDAITEGKPYPVKAVWFSFVNFVNQCANVNKILGELIPRLEFIVVADMFMTSTAEYADIVLPVCTFLEHSDLVNGQRFFHPYLQLQQKVIEPLYESKSDMRIVSELAKRLGFEKYFDKTDEEFIDVLLASRHPSVESITVQRLKEGPMEFRIVEPGEGGQFRTPSGRIEFYVERLREFGEALPVYKEPLESVRTPLAEKYPLVFISVHSRFSTHSMFRNVPSVSEIEPEPTLAINPADARRRNIRDGDMVVIFNDRGRAKLKARLNEGVRAGVVFTAEGWWFRHYAEGGNNCLTHDALNPAQDASFEPNMAMNDVLVEVKRA